MPPCGATNDKSVCADDSPFSERNPFSSRPRVSFETSSYTCFWDELRRASRPAWLSSTRLSTSMLRRSRYCAFKPAHNPVRMYEQQVIRINEPLSQRR